MSILIKDIFGKERPMPQEGYIDVRLHFRGGRIECATTQTGNPPFYATLKVVEIPASHGRLIDADKLNIHDVSPAYGFCVMGVTEEDIELAETVIEAEGETDGR